METLLLSSSENDIKKAAGILNNGGVVAIPTETVYGLAANALDGSVIKKIFIAKGRPMDNPLIVHVSSIDDIDKFSLVKEISDKARKLMEKFWPGPLTIILKKTENVPDEVSAGLDTVAIRCPSHKVANKLIKTASIPLAAPSANISGRPSPTTFSHVKNDMLGKVDAIIDGGQSDVGVESTVITLIADIPRLLRPGYITKEQIEDVIGKIDVDKAVFDKIDNTEKVSSPGMKYKHYSPKADVILLAGESEKFIDYVNRNSDKNTAVICYDDEKKNIDALSFTVGDENDMKAQAYNLFDILRKVDEENNITLVYAHLPKKEGIGMAVYNRLIRAAGFEVISLE